MEILGQLVEKQAPNWDLWSRHFTRYRQKNKLQLQLNNHGCSTDKYQQRFLAKHVSKLNHCLLIVREKDRHHLLFFVCVCFMNPTVMVWALYIERLVMAAYWDYLKSQLYSIL